MISRRALTTSCLPPTIRQLLSSRTASDPVQVNGWVKSVRRQKKVAFAMISDGSSDKGLQAVFTKVDLAKPLTNGCSVRLTGKLADSPGKGQDKELQVDQVELLGECDPAEYPIQKQALSVEHLRDHCHLRARTDEITAMIRLRDLASRSLCRYFEDQGFCYVHTPITTSSDCEGAGEAFRIAPPPSPDLPSSENPAEFFGRPAYLTVSSQLHLEALANAISRVYTLSPCFRAERSQTNRHLAEFWMLEAEWAFTRDIDDVCTVLEGSLRHVLKQAGASGEPVWTAGERARLPQLQAYADSDTAWPRLTYAAAVAELEAFHAASPRTFDFAPAWGRPLQSEHERWLAEHLARGPLFVTDYPAHLKAFYMRQNDAPGRDPRTVACVDLLVPGLGELAGGSLREEREDRLRGAMVRFGLGEEEYGWYLDLRRYGGAPHGGFGLGFERLISWMSGVENVRECIPIPRWAGRMLL
ncbi:asparaginyl-tRNA synthetase [Obba rivulosa]|uniref:asparagine--tRNA ligase n=1 Tax=Obba rivulosa TaxID=1052685 RepID=A0A8E2DHY6_9APHY|nr:asparaginyl-tRNA synthetase [Obba rivulosa]